MWKIEIKLVETLTKILVSSRNVQRVEKFFYITISDIITSS